MTWNSPRRSEIARRVRDIEVSIASGSSIDRALEAAGTSEADYLAWRAELAGVRVERVAELHRAGREAERAIDPKDYIGRFVAGACPVCGAHEGFENYTDNLRESGQCRGCGSFERQRCLAFVLRHRLGLGFDGPLRLPPRLAAHNTESTGALHQRLLASPRYSFSEYWGPDHRPGEIVNDVRHEDLQALSFADESLDLVLSSDVLEHMPDPYQAHAEIFRALRPGGAHIFTVPFSNQRPDDVRARLEDGEIRYFGEKLYHGDPVRPDEGILVWTIFGSDMLDRLEAIGFQPLMWRFSAPHWGVVEGAVVFEARKPPDASPIWLEHLQRVDAGQAPLQAEFEAELEAARSALAEREERLRAMDASASWRLTAPLRRIAARLRGFAHPSR
jgi:SAM-dependent methyltransferase